MSLKTFKILFIIADPKTEADVSQKLSDVRAVVFEIATVGTLAEALALLHRDSFDVLLASLAVPDYRGIESLRELILAATEAPVIVVSSAYDEAQALEAVRAGAEDYTVGSRMNSAAFERVILYSIERHMAHQRTALQFSVGTTKSVKQGDSSADWLRGLRTKSIRRSSSSGTTPVSCRTAQTPALAGATR
jgi:DNA-binding NarL/FixJ family response regulator